MGRSRGRWVSPGLVALVAMGFVLVLLVSPLLHHDLACHLKTPTHCNACGASPSASLVGIGAPVPTPRVSLLVVVRPVSDPREFLQGRRLSGRAPPTPPYSV